MYSFTRLESSREAPIARHGYWAIVGSQLDESQQHRLYFLPEPQGQDSLRPIFALLGRVL